MPFIKDNIMIVLNPSKVKLKFQEKLDIYKDMKNFGSLECPCCHSKEYVLWGFYERGITYMKQDQIYSETVKIQRIRCKSCGKTHAIFFFSWRNFHRTLLQKKPRILIKNSFSNIIFHVLKQCYK